VIIETGRLLLRALTPDDAAAIIAGDRGEERWADDYPTPGDVMVADAALAGRLAFAVDTMPWGLFAVVEKATGRSIGGIGFKNAPDGGGEVEIGYGIAQSFQGRGVATEALGALCDFARVGASSVRAETERENRASERVLEKCDFERYAETDQEVLWRRQL
jgi:RimJ/RimL family protein N-acetyltransferase